MKRTVYILAALLVTARLLADETNYKQELIRQFPFYNLAHGVFAPVYPAFARQLVQDYGITQGVCVDMGGADGSLAIELAKITTLTVYVVDISPAAIRLCNLLSDEAGLTGRVRAVEGDAQDLPLRDSFADLVVSRNSMFEWPDTMAGIQEAYRILKPGGVALLGGGLSRLLDEKTLGALVAWGEKKREANPDSWVEMAPDILTRLRQSGIPFARTIEGPTAFDWWLELRK